MSDMQYPPFRRALLRSYTQGWEHGKKGYLHDGCKLGVAAEIERDFPGLSGASDALVRLIEAAKSAENILRGMSQLADAFDNDDDAAAMLQRADRLRDAIVLFKKAAEPAGVDLDAVKWWKCIVCESTNRITTELCPTCQRGHRGDSPKSKTP